MLDLINKYRENFWKPKTMFYLGMLMIIPFLFLAVASYFEWGLLGMFDDWIGSEVIEERESLLTVFFTAITRMGDGWFSAIVTLIISMVILLKLKNKWLALWYVLTISLGAGVLNQVLKFIFRRERPDSVEHLITQGGYSFPSGHAMGSMVVYGALIFLIVRLARRKLTYLVATVGFGALIVLIGVSRVYLGVHYPSDIIGGYSVGAMVLAFSIGMYGLSLTRKPEMEDIDQST